MPWPACEQLFMIAHNIACKSTADTDSYYAPSRNIVLVTVLLGKAACQQLTGSHRPPQHVSRHSVKGFIPRLRNRTNGSEQSPSDTSRQRTLASAEARLLHLLHPSQS